MSVLIRGMEMPKNCDECPLLTEDGDYDVCFVGKRRVMWKWKHDRGLKVIHPKPDWCPLIEVPLHGRLGDLDKLEQMFVDIDNAPYSGFDGEEPFYSAEDAAQIIRLAPTVIPASEVAPDINAAHKTMEETPEIQHVGYDDAQLGREK